MKLLKLTQLSMLMLAICVSSASAVCLPNPFLVGWLNAQEVAGGHTIAVHVGKTDQELVNRLVNSPNIDNASSYTSQQIAELAITTGLAGVRNAVNNWANNANHGQRRVDNFVSAAIVGRVAYRPPLLANVVNSDRLRTVLQADGHGGCFLLTSFPTMPPLNGQNEVLDVDDVHSTPDQEYAALAGYLAGQFADSDVAGLTDQEAAASSVNHMSEEVHKLVVLQGEKFLKAPQSDGKLIGDWANRRFADDDAAKRWLEFVLAELRAAIAE